MNIFLGMFYCLTLNEMSDYVSKSHQANSYSYGTEEESLNKSQFEIKLLALMFIQGFESMKECPSSAISQIVSRCLRYYGYMDNFTSLIDQYYSNSYLDCTLLVPYQFLESPGGDLILKIEKHSAPITAVNVTSDNSNSYTFSLSDKLFCYCTSNVVELGQIKVAQSDSNGYNILITYIYESFEIKKVVPLKIFPGGFIIADKNTFISYSFDSSIYFQKKYENESILDLFLISSNHVCVCLKEKHYLDIYNIFTSELVRREFFPFKIQKLYTNLQRNYVILISEFNENERLVNVLLENMNLLVFKAKNNKFKEVKHGFKENLNFSTKENNEIDLVKMLEISCPGNTIVSLSFISNFNESAFDTGPQFIVCFDEGSFLFVNYRLKEKETLFFKPKITKKETIYFKIIGTLSTEYTFEKNGAVLLLGSNSFLYILYVFEEKNEKKEINLIEIPGSFDNGIFVNFNKIVGIDKTNIYFYSLYIDLPRNRYKFKKDNQINAHEDEITFLFLADKRFLFTASRDSTIKFFFINKTKSDLIQFDQTLSEITHITILDRNHVISLENIK